MTKEMTAGPVQEPIINKSPDEIMKVIMKIATLPDDPKAILQNLNNKIEQYKKQGDLSPEILKGLTELAYKTMMMRGLDNHYPMAETITQNRPLIIEFATRLVEEYDCKTPTEKSLAQVAAGAYGRIVEYSRLFNNCQRLEYLSHEKNGYYSILSKELDRAQRHFITALTTLRQLKSPDIKVSVRANTAFVAQNQQLNNHQPYENNKP
jgi:hypothetical protein